MHCCSFLQFSLFLYLDSPCRHWFSKILKFLSVGLSTFGDNQILENTQKNVILCGYPWKNFQGLLWSFPKSIAGKSNTYFSSVFNIFLKFILVKRYGQSCTSINFQVKSLIWWTFVVLYKKCYFKSKATLNHKIKQVMQTKWNDFL